jgi:hypothetical protein
MNPNSLPIAAAAEYGEGRIVTYGHPGMFGGIHDNRTYSHQLFINSLKWASGGLPLSKIVVGIGRVVDMNNIVEVEWYNYLKSVAKDVVVVTKGVNLKQVDVFIHSFGYKSYKFADDISVWVKKSGGGFIVQQSAWGGVQNMNAMPVRLSLHDNRAIAGSGIMFNAGGGGITDDQSDWQDVHAAYALSRLAPWMTGAVKEMPEKWRPYLFAVRNALVGEYGAGNVWCPAPDSEFVKRVKSVLEDIREADKPLLFPGYLGSDSRLKYSERAEVVQAIWLAAMRSGKAEDVLLAPGHEVFPGKCASGAMKKRVIKSLAGGSSKGWYATGIYVPAGVVLKIKLEPDGNSDSYSYSQQTRIYANWHARIGAHADSLSDAWKKDPLPRWASTTTLHYLHPTNNRFVKYLMLDPDQYSYNTIASPFGGLLFLQRPRSADVTATITIEGRFVEAPRYSLKSKDHAQKYDQNNQVPWGYLEGKHFVHVLPGVAFQKMKNLKKLAEFWDEVIVKANYFIGNEKPSEIAHQMFVPDVKISAGYMHSGYPIMTHLDVATPDLISTPKSTDLGSRKSKHLGTPLVINLKQLRSTGSWGHFHEIGHNLNQKEWTFRETGEVTNNLITLYLMHTQTGLKDATSSDWFGDSDAILDKVYDYIVSDSTIEYWDAGVALYFFAAMIKEIGWEDFRKVAVSLETRKMIELYWMENYKKLGMPLEVFQESCRHILSQAGDDQRSAMHGQWFTVLGTYAKEHREPYKSRNKFFEFIKDLYLLPISDQKKMDAWFTSLSERSGKNLYQHFNAYRVPVTSDAHDKIKAEYKNWVDPNLSPILDWGFGGLAEGVIRRLGNEKILSWKQIRELYLIRRTGKDGATANERLDHVYRLLCTAANQELSDIFADGGFEIRNSVIGSWEK